MKRGRFGKGSGIGSKNTALLLAAAMTAVQVFSGVKLTARAEGEPLAEKFSGFQGREVVYKYGSADDSMAYSAYLEAHEGAGDAAADVEVPLQELSGVDGPLEIVEYEGRQAVLSAEESEYVQFTVRVPESGMYQIQVDYYLEQGVSDAAKRILYIDGATPFTESADMVFDRFFRDEGEPVVNSVGDETRPSQVEIPGWRSTGLQDTTGITSEDFRFYLEAGEHTLQLIYSKIDMYIGGIRLAAPVRIPSYEEVKASYDASGYKPANAETVHFQAELQASEKNDPTLRRENDGDPLVEPASDVSRKLNVMGGYRWRSGNQSITWEFEVPASGLYKIGMYQQQSWNDGLSSYRQIAIDGQVPFRELEDYCFEYDTRWSLLTLSGETGEPFQFYLTEGKHTITMTVKMGELAPVLDSIEKDIEILSEMMMNITLLAGNDPDPNYDYQFFDKIGNLREQMEYLVQSMEEKYDLVTGMSNKTPAMANNFMTIKAQLEEMLADPISIARKISDLSNSQENLSNWYLSMQSLPLMIDYFDIGSPAEEWKSVSSNFLQRMGATARQFLSSFTKDYDNVGGVLGEDVQVDTTLNVWIARGAEWAEVIKEMADEKFTPESGIAINVNVLPGTQLNAGNVNALMLSITSGKAPDVALGVDITSPVEFAIRDQVYDLSEMEGFEEVKGRFVEATLTPYEYLGGTYALPETMNFNVLYYRKDTLARLGLDVPDTWQDVYDFVLPAFYQEGLQFYFARDFTQFLFQNGGSFYSGDGFVSALDTPEAYQAFKEYTELFTNYGVPETANFYQYFRSGIMSLGVGDFNTYMQLSVAAPEIAGKWGIAPLPGHYREDGTLDRTAGAITDKGDIILKQSGHPEESWEFLKWWSSTETQTQFAREVEALMGAEARWNTANKEAFLSLAWSREDVETLQTQWEWARETPTVLGGYMTTRHLTNAWTSVVISGGDVREALEQAVKDINRELRMKQEEYGVTRNE